MRSDQEIIDNSEGAAIVGGGYYQPVVELGSVGRILLKGTELTEMDPQLTEEPSFFLHTLFARLQNALSAGEVIIGEYKHAAGFQLAPLLYSEERLANFETQVAKGLLARVAYYALPEGYAIEHLEL